jgi:hypothetical protein
LRPQVFKAEACHVVQQGVPVAGGLAGGQRCTFID